MLTLLYLEAVKRTVKDVFVLPEVGQQGRKVVAVDEHLPDVSELPEVGLGVAGEQAVRHSVLQQLWAIAAGGLLQHSAILLSE